MHLGLHIRLSEVTDNESDRISAESDTLSVFRSRRIISMTDNEYDGEQIRPMWTFGQLIVAVVNFTGS